MIHADTRVQEGDGVFLRALNSGARTRVLSARYGRLGDAVHFSKADIVTDTLLWQPDDLPNVLLGARASDSHRLPPTAELGLM
jgi:hypothetical protein